MKPRKDGLHFERERGDLDDIRDRRKQAMVKSLLEMLEEEVSALW